MTHKSDVSLWAAFAATAFVGVWVPTLGIVIGVFLGDHARNHAVVDSAINEVDSNVEVIPTSIRVFANEMHIYEIILDSLSDHAGDPDRDSKRLRVLEDFFPSAGLCHLVVGIENAAGTDGQRCCAASNEHPLQVQRSQNESESASQVSDDVVRPWLLDPCRFRIADKVGHVEFETASHSISEEQQRGTVEHAVHAIAHSNQKGDILVLGFADSCGLPAGNLNLSELRAGAVAEAMFGRVNGRAIFVLGMGESLGEYGYDVCRSQQHRSAHVFLLESDG